jgi:hypothetical protein
MGYLVHYHYATGAHAAAGPRCVGILFFGRPEATRCYDGGLTYGSLGDVQTGRAQYDRWEVLNLARVWFSPLVQPGGLIHRLGPDSGLPGYADRRGVWRSTLASSTIRQALDRIGYDRAQLLRHTHPPRHHLPGRRLSARPDEQGRDRDLVDASRRSARRGAGP